KHWGSVGIQSGTLEFKDGHLTGGEITLDLANLTCADLANNPLHDVLIAHLHNDDFLDLEKFPTAKLTILSAQASSQETPGAPNLNLEAELTIKGITHGLTFSAATGVTPEGKAAAQAAFAIDRTQWGINYGSGKLFHRLGGHLVNDLIEFQAKIVTA
ncbi:MAG: YceI family protein, partial [Verrucomicrobiota bacterium]